MKPVETMRQWSLKTIHTCLGECLRLTGDVGGNFIVMPTSPVSIEDGGPLLPAGALLLTTKKDSRYLLLDCENESLREEYLAGILQAIEDGAWSYVPELVC